MVDENEFVCEMCKEPKHDRKMAVPGPIKRVLGNKQVSFKLNAKDVVRNRNSDDYDDYNNLNVDSWADLGGVLEDTRAKSAFVVCNDQDEEYAHFSQQRRRSETKFFARAIKAHGLSNDKKLSLTVADSTRSTMTTNTLATDFDTTEEEFQRE